MNLIGFAIGGGFDFLYLFGVFQVKAIAFSTSPDIDSSLIAAFIFS
jgi:hypothetical protein